MWSKEHQRSRPLYWWVRRSERDMDLERPGLSDDELSNALRFGITVGVNQGNTGF
jgi:hypothetical protein